MQESVPESGSTVAGSEGESVTIFCRVLNETIGTQVVTEWFLLRRNGGTNGPETLVGSQRSNFMMTGKPLPKPSLPGQTFQTNLTIQSLNQDLDRAILDCGEGGTPPTLDADFTLRIYSMSDQTFGICMKPSLLNQTLILKFTFSFLFQGHPT